MVPRLVTVAAVLAVPVKLMPAPLVPRMMAPALLIRRPMNPTSMPSVLPVMRALLVSAAIDEVAAPLMPRPLAEVMLPVLTIVLLPGPVRFTAALSSVPTSDVPPVMLPLLVRPTETALMPYRPPEIVPRLIKVPIEPLLRMPSPLVDTILAWVSFSSSVMLPAATAAPEPASMRPMPVLVSVLMALLP